MPVIAKAAIDASDNGFLSMVAGNTIGTLFETLLKKGR